MCYWELPKIKQLQETKEKLEEMLERDELDERVRQVLRDDLLLIEDEMESMSKHINFWG